MTYDLNIRHVSHHEVLDIQMSFQLEFFPTIVKLWGESSSLTSDHLSISNNDSPNSGTHLSRGISPPKLNSISSSSLDSLLVKWTILPAPHVSFPWLYTMVIGFRKHLPAAMQNYTITRLSCCPAICPKLNQSSSWHFPWLPVHTVTTTKLPYLTHPTAD